MKNPSNLIPTLMKDVSKKYRNSTKEKIDERSKVLPHMVDLKMRVVNEIKYAGYNGVLKTLYPSENELFLAVSGLSWKYGKLDAYIKSNGNCDYLYEELFRLCQGPNDTAPRYNNGGPKNGDYSHLYGYGLDLLNPFFIFYLGEMIPWSCIEILHTMGNDYIIINDYNFPRSSNLKSMAVKNMILFVKNNLPLWESINAINGIECLQFYSTICYLEAGYAFTNAYNSLDMTNMKVLFSIRDDISSHISHDNGIHTFNVISANNEYDNLNVYSVPIDLTGSGNNNNETIKVFLPYCLYETPGMYIAPRKYYGIAPNFDNGDIVAAYTNANRGFATIYHVASLPNSFAVGKDIENFKDINPKKICINCDNSFISASRKFGSLNLFHRFACNTDKYSVRANSVSIIGSKKRKIAIGSSVGNILQFAGYLSTISDTNIGNLQTISSEMRLDECISHEYSYPSYSYNQSSTPYLICDNQTPINGITCNGTLSQYIYKCSIYDIIFFDRHGAQNDIKEKNRKLSTKSSIQETLIVNNIKNYDSIDDKTFSTVTYNTLIANLTGYGIGGRVVSLPFDIKGDGIQDDEFLAYTSMMDISLLMDTIKEFTPIFQTTFFVEDENHEFYTNQDSSGMAYVYRGEKGEPNYLMEFINGSIPDTYSSNVYDASRYKFIPLDSVSESGDTYEFIHFEGVYNDIYDEYLGGEYSVNSDALNRIFAKLLNGQEFYTLLDTNPLALYSLIEKLKTTKVLAYPIGDASYANRELMVNSAGYEFYFDYPYDMNGNINIGYMVDRKQVGTVRTIYFINNSGITAYECLESVYSSMKKSMVSTTGTSSAGFGVNYLYYFSLDANGKIDAIDRVDDYRLIKAKDDYSDADEISYVFHKDPSASDQTTIIRVKRIRSQEEINPPGDSTRRYYKNKGVNHIMLDPNMVYDPEDEDWFEVNFAELDGNVYSFSKETLERIYLNKSLTIEDKEEMKNLSYDFVYDFYKNKKYINYNEQITTEPITWKTYGSDFYFDPHEGYPLLELSWELSYSDSEYIELDDGSEIEIPIPPYSIAGVDINYINSAIKIVPETQFRHTKINISMPCISIDLPGEFQYCREQNRYLVFLNGSLIDTANYRITSPKSDLPFNKVSLYSSIPLEEGDYIEVFYLPQELIQVEYRKEMINNKGDIIVDFGTIPYLMQYLTKDTCMVFINGKKVPSTDIRDISMNRLSINGEKLSSNDNLIVYSFIPFLPMSDENMAPIQHARATLLTGTGHQNSFSNLIAAMDDDLKQNISSIWDTVINAQATNIILGGYISNITETDDDMFENAVDDIAIVYEIIRDNYVRGIISGVPFVYDYDDVIFDTQIDIAGDEVLMTDEDSIKLINICNALLEHSYILDRDYQGYDIYLPDYSVETLGHDTVYIMYTPSQMERNAQGYYTIDNIITTINSSGTRMYFVDTNQNSNNMLYINENDLFIDN